ncbi:hypothetical protein GOP47_0027947 [Adiantum capillus-veneris]|nr:hypothetical protein GOP47_0027947 [Adiantum capillus-veneris]
MRGLAGQSGFVPVDRGAHGYELPVALAVLCSQAFLAALGFLFAIWLDNSHVPCWNNTVRNGFLGLGQVAGLVMLVLQGWLVGYWHCDGIFKRGYERPGWSGCLLVVLVKWFSSVMASSKRGVAPFRPGWSGCLLAGSEVVIVKWFSSCQVDQVFSLVTRMFEVWREGGRLPAHGGLAIWLSAFSGCGCVLAFSSLSALCGGLGGSRLANFVLAWWFP